MTFSVFEFFYFSFLLPFFLSSFYIFLFFHFLIIFFTICFYWFSFCKVFFFNILIYLYFFCFEISWFFLFSISFRPDICLKYTLHIFPTAPTMAAVGKEPNFSFFLFLYSGDLNWIGSDKSFSTLIGRHKLGVVQMHEYQPLTKLWCVHLLNPAMQGLTERCRTQIF